MQELKLIHVGKSGTRPTSPKNNTDSMPGGEQMSWLKTWDGDRNILIATWYMNIHQNVKWLKNWLLSLLH